MGVVVRRYNYIDILILLIPTPLVSVLFYSSIPTFCSFYMYNTIYIYIIYNIIYNYNYSSIKRRGVYFFTLLRGVHGVYLRGRLFKSGVYLSTIMPIVNSS